jgi:hypothetical protein
MRREYLAYGAVFLFFAGVVLWATEPMAGGRRRRPERGGPPRDGRARRPAPVLVVGRCRQRLDSLHRAFEDAGFDLEVCPGPENSACPAVHGRPCPAHDHVVAAVVVRHPDEAGALPPCGEALHVPEIAVEEHSDRQIEVDGRYARVGLERGPEAVLDALDRISAA